MENEFQVKDSGERKVFGSGMVRDTDAGKVRFDLLYWPMIRRAAIHMTKGAEKYGEANWKLADSPEEAIRFRASLMRHLDQYLAGDRSEDHASAVIFGLSALEYMREERNIILPPL